MNKRLFDIANTPNIRLNQDYNTIEVKPIRFENDPNMTKME